MRWSFNFTKDKTGFTFTNGFQKMLDESGCKPNKMWVE